MKTAVLAIVIQLDICDFCDNKTYTLSLYIVVRLRNPYVEPTGRLVSLFFWQFQK